MKNRINSTLVNNPVLSVLLFSGLAGLCLGLSNATWQVTVETGQVLAGIVKYPVDNPFYMYHIKLFTIINHISALLLHLLGSEKILSILFSAFLGMISFQAISLFIFAINRDVFISLLGVIFIYFANYVGAEVVYPIWLLGQPHTYGILGLSFIVLVIALLGAGAYRTGLFCLGFAPCIHPSWGAWLVVIILLAAIFQRDFAKNVVKEHFWYLIAGGFIAFLSLSYQLYLMRELPMIDPELKKQYFESFVKYWGSHQRKFYYDSATLDTVVKRLGIFFCVYSIITGFLGLRFFKKISSLSFVFRVMIISGILSLLLGLITQIPPENVPSYLLILMPGRYVNLNNVVLAASLLGILTSKINKKLTTNYNIFLLLLIGTFFSRHREVQMVIFAVILLWFGFRLSNRSSIKLLAIREHKLSYEKLLLFFMAIFLLINLPREKFVKRFLFGPFDFKDRTNNTFYSTIHTRDGLLLTTHYSSMISLKTRRPILADMASPNTMFYTPESAKAFSEILKKVYGVDLLIPPPVEFQHREIRPELYKWLWEERTIEGWNKIREEFHVTDVLTRSDWRLSLPVVAESEEEILYEIPASRGIR